MTQTISTLLSVNLKKLMLVSALAVALVFSVAGIANAEVVGQGGDCSEASQNSCGTDLFCDSDDTCQPVSTQGGGDKKVTNDPNDPTVKFGIAKYGEGGAAELGLGDEDLDDAVVGLINVLLGFLGLIAVIIILIGGFRWMTAGGNEDKVAEARKTIFAGIIGLAIILFAWGITTFVVEQLGRASGLDTTF